MTNLADKLQNPTAVIMFRAVDPLKDLEFEDFILSDDVDLSRLKSSEDLNRIAPVVKKRIDHELLRNHHALMWLFMQDGIDFCSAWKDTERWFWGNEEEGRQTWLFCEFPDAKDFFLRINGASTSVLLEKCKYLAYKGQGSDFIDFVTRRQDGEFLSLRMEITDGDI